MFRDFFSVAFFRLRYICQQYSFEKAMLSRIYSFIILSINILIGLVLLCFNAEFYHDPSWVTIIDQEQKHLFSWNMAFSLIVISYNLILLLLVDSLTLAKRTDFFFIYGIICSIFLVIIHLTNIILFLFILSETHLLKPSLSYFNLSLFSCTFVTSLFDWIVCYDLCFYRKY